MWYSELSVSSCVDTELDEVICRLNTGSVLCTVHVRYIEQSALSVYMLLMQACNQDFTLGVQDLRG